MALPPLLDQLHQGYGTGADGCGASGAPALGNLGSSNYITLSMFTLAMLARTVGFVVDKHGEGAQGDQLKAL